MGPIAFWGYSQGGGAAASAAELASSYAPELKVVGTYAGAPPADLKELFPYADGSVLVGAVGYALNSVITAYPEHADAIRSKLTPRGEDLLFKVADQCVAETIAKFMFRHLQPYFNEDINQLVNEEPFSSLFDEQKLGRFKPNAPVMILSNRYDPLVPWTAANQLGRDWCAQGADVQFWTNEEPPFLNKAGRQPRAADAGRRRAGDAVDRRPVQRVTDHTELRRVLGVGGGVGGAGYRSGS